MKNEEVLVVRLLSPDSIRRAELGKLVYQQLVEGHRVATEMSKDPNVVNESVDKIASLQRFYVRCLFKRPLGLLRDMVAFYLQHGPNRDDPGVRVNIAEIIKTLGLDRVPTSMSEFIPPVKYATTSLHPADIMYLFDVSEEDATNIVLENEAKCHEEAVQFYRQMAQRLGEQYGLAPRQRE